MVSSLNDYVPVSLRTYKRSRLVTDLAAEAGQTTFARWRGHLAGRHASQL